MSTVVAAPATTPNANFTPTEAMIICCALAWKGNPLAGLDMQRSYAQRIVTVTRGKHHTRDIMNWCAETDPGTWSYRWAWGRRVTREHFASATGIDQLPTSHEDIPRM